MRVLVANHPSALEHDTGLGHPERPDRVRSVLKGIRSSGLEVVEIEAPEIRRSELALVHDASYIEMIEAICASGGGALDMDTVVSDRSWQAALTAAGGVKKLVEELANASNSTGYALTRPPGHHALRNRGMGFCVFNNVAVAAALLRSHGERVAILDWDVHHGNGTQILLGQDPGVLYVSIHEAPFYPFTGDLGDIDRGEAKGTTVNIPVPAGTAGDVYRRIWSDLVLPVLRQFVPTWVLISCGYDAHRDDPLADLELISEDYGWLAGRLAEVHPPERTVTLLEGGYNLQALQESSSFTVQGLAGIADVGDETGFSSDRSRAAFEQAREAISRHWQV